MEIKKQRSWTYPQFSEVMVHRLCGGGGEFQLGLLLSDNNVLSSNVVQPLNNVKTVIKKLTLFINPNQTLRS